MGRNPLLKEPKPMVERAASEMLSPSDHLKLLVDLMKPAGPELSRRWLAALTLVPEEERKSVIKSVEAEIIRQYGDD
jgi:hypothetical protein